MLIKEEILAAFRNSLEGVIIFLPRLGGMLLTFLIGWIIAGMARRLTLQILKIIQLEPFAEKVGLNRNLERLGSKVTSSELIANLVKWSVVFMFLLPAVEILGLEQITVMLQGLLGYIPNVVIAVVMVMFGAIIADLMADFVRHTAAALATSTANFLAGLAKYAILVFSILAALSQLKIATTMIHTLFTGLVAMLALAGGLAFGLGGREIAAEILQDLRRSLQEKED